MQIKNNYNLEWTTKFNFTCEFYVPKDYAEIKREDGAGAVVYASACGLIAMGFSGKRQKPDFQYPLWNQGARRTVRFRLDGRLDCPCPAEASSASARRASQLLTLFGRG